MLHCSCNTTWPVTTPVTVTDTANVTRYLPENLSRFCKLLNSKPVSPLLGIGKSCATSLGMYGRRKTDQGGLVSKYSNSFSIGSNGYMFIFDFGVMNAGGDGHIHSRVIVNPADAEEFSQLMVKSLLEHVARYGPIKKEGDTAPCVPSEQRLQ